MILKYDAFAVSMEKTKKKTKKQVLYGALQKILQPLSESARPGFTIKVCGKNWKCHPALIS